MSPLTALACTIVFPLAIAVSEDPCAPPFPKPTFTIHTVAGWSTIKSGEIGDSGPAKDALLYHPTALAFDAGGDNLYICDQSHNRIRKVTFVGDEPSTITTVVGTGAPGVGEQADGAADEAMLAQPAGIALDATGHLFIADYANHVVRMVTDVASGAGEITTIAGKWNDGPGLVTAPARDCELKFPNAVAVDSAGIVWVADTDNNRVQRLEKKGDRYWVSTLPALLKHPQAVLTDNENNLYVANSVQHEILKLLAKVAGKGQDGFACDTKGDHSGEQVEAAVNTFLFNPVGMAFAENERFLYIADTNNHRIRMIDFTPDNDPLVAIETPTLSVVAGASDLNTPENCGEDYGLTEQIPEEAGGFSGDGSLASLNGQGSNGVKLMYPLAVAARFNGSTGKYDIYIADTVNHRIRRIRGSDGVIETVVGRGLPTLFDEGCSPVEARLHFPAGVVTNDDSMFILDHAHNRVVKVRDGTCNTFAGTGVGGHSGDGGLATQARIGGPVAGIAVDGEGSVYFNDDRRYVRKVSEGTISTVAGCHGDCAGAGCCSPYDAVNVDATSASLEQIAGIAIDPVLRHLYIADPSHHRILRVDLSANKLSLWGGTGVDGYSGDDDGTTVDKANFEKPFGLAWHKGSLYVADSGRVRRIDNDQTVHWVAGDPSMTYGEDGSCAKKTGLWGLNAVALDDDDNIYVSLGDVVRMIDATSHAIYTIAGKHGRSGYTIDSGLGRQARLWGVGSLCVDSDNNVLVVDTENNVVRMLRRE